VSSTGGSATAVVCDDDGVTRSVITQLLEEMDVTVLAEADRALDAIDLIERFGPDLVVVDIGLRVGSGREVIDHVRHGLAACQIIAFTSYAAAVEPGPGVRVVEKPDFDGLKAAIASAISAAGPTTGGDRRSGNRVVEPVSLRGQDGLDDPADFYRVLADSDAHDALIAIPCDELDTDLVRTVRRCLRVQDRLVRRQATLIVLLVGGGEVGARAVLDRLARSCPDASTAARTTVVAEHGDGHTALQAVIRAAESPH
jgi:CheY-like chemotaxis protein